MTVMPENDWSAGGNKADVRDDPTRLDGFKNQQGKPVKALIGIALLVLFAVVLARMNPVPHESASAPAWTTGQSTGSGAR
ncbi:MAG: hypothetical protein AB7F72_12575 [Afipia sp.]